MCLRIVEYKEIDRAYKLLEVTGKADGTGLIEGVYRSPFYWTDTGIILTRSIGSIGIEYIGKRYTLQSLRGEHYPAGIHAYIDTSCLRYEVMLVLRNPNPEIQLPTDGSQVVSTSWIIDKVVYDDNGSKKEATWIGLLKSLMHHLLPTLKDFWVIGNSKREVLSRAKAAVRDTNAISGILTVDSVQAREHIESREEYVLVRREKTVKVSKVSWGDETCV